MANEFKVKKGLIVDGVNTVLDIQGTSGQLFSVTDSLTGDLFSVSDISGIPIFNVNSSGVVSVDGSLRLDDSNKIQLGDSQDLELYHDGTHSYISDNGTGELRFNANGATRFKIGSDVASLTGTDFAIAAGRKLYLDGQSNTYITESSADTVKFFVGGQISLTLTDNAAFAGNISTLGQVSIADATTYARLNLSGAQANGISYSLYTAIPGVSNSGFTIRRTSGGDSNVLSFDGSNNATFVGTIAASNFSGSSEGANTGDQTLPTIASLGAVTISTAQTITGAKTFSSNAIFEEQVIIGDNSVIETQFPASGASLHVHETASGSGVAFGDEAHVVISTGAINTGAQGYQGSLWFGSSDHPAGGSTAGAGNQFVWRNAGIASTSGTADTGGAAATGNLEFYTNSASGTASKRLTIEANGDVEIHKSGNDTTGKLTIAGNNNTGTPGQKTSGTIEHRGEHLKTVITHAGSDVITIGTGTQTTFGGDAYLAAASNEGNLFFGTADANYKIFGGGTFGYMGYNTGGYHRFNVQGSEVLSITSSGNLQFKDNGLISSNTADGADNAQVIICGGGASGDTRGASVHLAGNENGNGGLLQLRAGDGSVGGIRLYEGGSERMRIYGGKVFMSNTGSTGTAASLLHIKGSGDAIRVESTNTGAGGAQMDLLHFTTSPADEDTHSVINMGGYYSGTTSVYGTQILSKWTDVSERHARLEFRTCDTTISTVLTLAHDKKATFTGALAVSGQALFGGVTARSTYGITAGYNRTTAFVEDSDATDANRGVSIVNEASNTTNSYATLGFRISPLTTTSMGDLKFVRTGADENSLIWCTRHGSTFHDRLTIKSDGNVAIKGTGVAVGETVLDIQGSQGQLFSVANSLSGDLFSVSDVSGVPIFNVNSSGLSNFDGNVLVGKTAVNNALVGVQLMTDGSINPTVSGDTVARFNRLSNDGEVIRIQKDTALIGAIGTYNGVPWIGYQGGAGGGIMFNGSSIEPTLLGSSRSNNTNDIGSSNYKWRYGYFGTAVNTHDLVATNSAVISGPGSGTSNILSVNHGAGSHTGIGIKITSANSGHAIYLTGSVGGGYARLTSAYGNNPDFYTSGTITAGEDVIAYSDIKLKENIKTLDGSKVYDMHGVSFTRKDTGKEGSGVIAQEMQKVAPELVNEIDGTLGVSYGNITGYLIEAIKDLKTEIEELKKQIK